MIKMKNSILTSYDQKTHEFTYEVQNIYNNYVDVIVENPDGYFDILYVKTEEDAINLGLVEDLRSGCFVSENLLKKIPKKESPRFESSKFFYDYSKRMPKTNNISENKDYTFGVELETYSGYIPNYIRKRLSISSHYDGSIRNSENQKMPGGEYVTDVLRYDSGFKHLKDITFELSRRCLINHTCSVHIHFGNIIFNKEFIVLLYKLSIIIQNELFLMMPPSRRKNEYCQFVSSKPLELVTPSCFKDVRKVNKNDTKAYINDAYSQIVKCISLGKMPSSSINKNLNHPNGRYCGYNRSSPRYWWLNFLPTLFTIESGRDHTIEFRAHSATLNYEKIKNFILICMGILSFVEDHKEDIYQARLVPGSITLSEIMLKTFPKKAQYLINYITQRKIKFASPNTENDEYDYVKNISESDTNKISIL